MNSRKFFAYVWRVNGLVLLVAGVLAVAVLAAVGFHIVRDTVRPRQVDNVANTMAGEVENEKARLGDFARVEGSEVMRAPLSIEQTYALGVGSKDADSVRNYLFIDAKSRASHWLMPAMDKVILRDFVLPGAEYGEKRQPVRAVVYAIVEQDTDKDGRLTSRDRKTVAVAGPEGLNFRRIAEGVDEVNFADLVTPSVVSIIYSKGARLRVSNIDLEDAAGSIESYDVEPKRE